MKMLPGKSLRFKTSSSLLKIISWISDPHPSITDIAQRKQAQLSAGLALVLVISTIAGIAATLNQGLNSAVVSIMINFVISIIAYVFSRIQYSRIGSVLLIANFLVGGFYLAYSGTDDTGFSLLATVTLSLIIGNAFLSVRGMAILTGITLILTLSVPFVAPQANNENIITVTGQFLTWGVMFMIFTGSRNAIEKERLAQIQNANDELEALQDKLELRVIERTLELNLAAEMGQILSQVREREELLQQAVNLIHDRFNLYYVQIYLLDSQNRNLVLQAGSGEIGNQLRNRGHRLPIDITSLNGRAVFERKPVLIPDVSSEADFRPNQLLPLTRSELCYPLVVGEKVVGVLDLQSKQENGFSEDRLPAYNSLSGQLSIAIENASLYQQQAQATSLLEAQTRRLTMEGWREYLNAIDKQEHISIDYFYGNRNALNVSNSNDEKNSTLIELIKIAGAPIGQIKLEKDSRNEWSDSEKEILHAVSVQVANQIENIRLLDQAERYRLEAESVSRQFTRESWQAFLRDEYDGEVSYCYDQNQVQKVDEITSIENDGLTITEPIKVRNEEIGELVVSGLETLDDQMQSLISTISERLSAHIENLRLFTQTQHALAETDALYNIISDLNEARDYKTILSVLSKRTILQNADQSLLMFMFDRPLSKDSYPEWVFPIAWLSENKINLADRYPVNAFENEPRTLFAHSTVVLENVDQDPRLDRVTRTLFEKVFNSRSTIIIPLVIGEDAIGFIMGNYYDITHFNETEINRLSTIANQVAIAVQGMQLLERTLARARREMLLRELTNQVNSAVSTDTILQRAAEQLGKALKRQTYAYLSESKALNSD